MLALSGTIVLACAVATARQAEVWRNGTALFEHAIAVTTGNHVAHNLLGLELYDRRRFDDAAREFEAAIAAFSAMHEAHSNLGLSLAARGRFAEAIPHYDDALRFRADYATAYLNLAIALAHTGDTERARESAVRASRLAVEHDDGALAAQAVTFIRALGPET